CSTVQPLPLGWRAARASGVTLDCADVAGGAGRSGHVALVDRPRDAERWGARRAVVDGGTERLGQERERAATAVGERVEGGVEALLMGGRRQSAGGAGGDVVATRRQAVSARTRGSGQDPDCREDRTFRRAGGASAEVDGDIAVTEDRRGRESQNGGSR